MIDAKKTGNGNRDVVKPQQRSNRRKNRGNGFEADWGSADANKVLGAIAAVCKTGCAIRFGYTRDGGALAIGIIGDGEPYTEYIRPTEDIDIHLEGLTLDFTDKDK